MVSREQGTARATHRKNTQGLGDSSDPQAWLLGRVNQLYATPANPETIKDYKRPVGFIED